MSLAKIVTIVAAAAGLAASAHASVVFSENFNSGFQGAYIETDTSDRFGSTIFSFIKNADGFTFSGGAYLATDSANLADSALYLNENAGQGDLTLSGLTAGARYNVSYLISGDNEPGQPYVFDLAADGTNIATVNGVVGFPGTNPGTVENASFIASGSSEDLTFSQASVTEGSPIIDNIVISSVPEPMTWAMMLVGLGMAGATLRRRQSVRLAV